MSVLDKRPENRIERRKQETRQRLIEAASFLMQTVGFQKITIQAITDKADLGYGTFYVHFEHKEALIWEVFHGWSEMLLQELEAEISHLPSPLKEYRGWLHYFESISQFKENFAAMFAPNGNTILRAYYQAYLVKMIQCNLEEKRYIPAAIYASLPTDYMAQFIAGMQLQLGDWLISANCPYTANEMATLLFRTVYHHAPPER